MFDKKYLNTVYTCLKAISYFPTAEEFSESDVINYTYEALANSASNEDARKILNSYFFLHKYNGKISKKLLKNKRKWKKLVSQPKPKLYTSNVHFPIEDNFYIINDLSKNGDTHDFLLINSCLENHLVKIGREENKYFFEKEPNGQYLLNNVDGSPKAEIHTFDSDLEPKDEYYEISYADRKFHISGNKLPGWKIYKPSTKNIYYVVEDKNIKNNQFLIKDALCAFSPLTSNEERQYNFMTIKAYKEIDDKLLLSLLGALINQFIFEDISSVDVTSPF